uniref:Uncharacterized protein n=2 Tax=Picea TaxID=3328 RepID=A0A101LYQ4_PICGL|nr:hypothetical protein ABT39_MTgene4795 [Picea glauca]QHR91687.1 hypothetical protein Q903MT_gene5723 [Picea sitchensis]
MPLAYLLLAYLLSLLDLALALDPALAFEKATLPKVVVIAREAAPHNR